MDGYPVLWRLKTISPESDFLQCHILIIAQMWHLVYKLVNYIYIDLGENGSFTSDLPLSFMGFTQGFRLDRDNYTLMIKLQSLYSYSPSSPAALCIIFCFFSIAGMTPCKTNTFHCCLRWKHLNLWHLRYFLPQLTGTDHVRDRLSVFPNNKLFYTTIAKQDTLHCGWKMYRHFKKVTKFY